MKQNKKNDIDMLNGPLAMKILMFALPLAASSILQQLFNSIDVAVVGRFASSQALAAVGSNGPVISLLINLFLGISMGANVIISNHIGQKDNNSIHDAINTVAVVALWGGIFLMFLGIAVARPILEMMDTPHDVIEMAVLYLRIYFVGIPFFLIFNFGSAILRSMGDTRRPLYILVVAGIVNTLLNLLFVICFGMGVAGVAVATDIANAISAILIVVLLLHEKEPYRLELKKMKIHGNELRRMVQIGVPAGVQGMIFSFSNVLLQATINGYGSAAVAGSAAALNFEYYCYFMISAFNGAAISFIGQNYGAGKNDRVRKVFVLCMIMSIVFCGALNWIFIWQQDFFVGLFTTVPVVHHYAYIRMDIVLATQAIACSYEIAGSSLRGMGISLLPTLLTVVGTCFLRIGWIYLVCPNHPGFDNLLIVYPVSWVITGTLMLSAYALKTRRLLAS